MAHSIALSEFCGALLRSLDKAPSFSGKRIRPDLAIFTERPLLRVMHQRRATWVILPETAFPKHNTKQAIDIVSESPTEPVTLRAMSSR
ncbi:MAG: hypothetical protein ACJ73N_15895 [Bryobacteraceae bacterium]